MSEGLIDRLNMLGGLLDTLCRLQSELRELGVCMQIWSSQGVRLDDGRPMCEFCPALHSPQSAEALGDVASTVLTDGEPVTNAVPGQCCMLGVPLYQRRRMIGAVTLCYPPLELLEPGHAAAMASRLGMPDDELARLLGKACRHSASQAQDVRRLLEWVIKREQDLFVANGELANLTSNLATTYEELSLLYRISGSMKVTQEPHEFLRTICNDLLEVMGIEAAAGLIYAYPPDVEDQVVMSGSMDLNADQVRLLAATHLEPRLSTGNRSIVDNKFVVSGFSGLGGRVRNLIAVPLLSDERSSGMLIGINKRGRGPGGDDFDSVDLKLIGSIGNQAAVFLQNYRLYSDVQDLLMGVLHALTSSIDAKDPYTRGHSQRVATLSRLLAEACGLSPARTQRIYLSGLLHDIGKIGVPERVLCKEGRLTPEEYETVKKHPTIGATILRGIRQLDDVVVGILTHHERPDGRGYPRGLSGAQVPLEGRLVGLADVFDAMTSDRTYRKAVPIPEVLTEIQRCAGTQFDPDLVKHLLAMDLSMVMDRLRNASAPAGPEALQEILT